MDARERGERVGPLVAAGVLLGAGLGGFLDGIALHQLAQWHNMLSSIVPPVDLPRMKYNMLWDGVFHALVWLLTAAGLALLWWAGRQRDVPWSGRVLAGALLAGWGVFNFVEGLINHQLLGLHHVRPGPTELGWDLAFLASGVLFMLGGWALARRAPPVAGGARPIAPATPDPRASLVP